MKNFPVSKNSKVAPAGDGQKNTAEDHKLQATSYKLQCNFATGKLHASDLQREKLGWLGYSLS